jgi:hypothetical protein
MKRSSFADMPTPDLFREFTEVAREESEAALWFDTRWPAMPGRVFTHMIVGWHSKRRAKNSRWIAMIDRRQ